MYHSGDFGLDLEDSTGEYVEDCYWHRVNFRGATPVEIVLMA